MAVIQWIVLAVPAFIFFFLANVLHKINVEQCCCAWADALEGKCTEAGTTIPVIIYTYTFAAVVVMYIYSMLYYLRILDRDVSTTSTNAQIIVLGMPIYSSTCQS